MTVIKANDDKWLGIKLFLFTAGCKEENIFK